MNEVTNFKSIGLSEQAASLLLSLLEKHLPGGVVILYGSRVKGTFTARSDLDLVVKDVSTPTRHLLSELQEAIDESDFPYLCDIQYFEDLKNAQLIDHIQRLGQVLYSKPSSKQELL